MARRNHQATTDRDGTDHFAQGFHASVYTALSRRKQKAQRSAKQPKLKRSALQVHIVPFPFQPATADQRRHHYFTPIEHPSPCMRSRASATRAVPTASTPCDPSFFLSLVTATARLFDSTRSPGLHTQTGKIFGQRLSPTSLDRVSEYRLPSFSSAATRSGVDFFPSPSPPPLPAPPQPPPSSELESLASSTPSYLFRALRLFEVRHNIRGIRA